MKKVPLFGGGGDVGNMTKMSFDINSFGMDTDTNDTTAAHSNQVSFKPSMAFQTVSLDYDSTSDNANNGSAASTFQKMAFGVPEAGTENAKTAATATRVKPAPKPEKNASVAAAEALAQDTDGPFAYRAETHNYQYDLFVIGGGSGGISAAKAAAAYGANVALADFVRPSETKGTTWGLGGTCVNVGCIPKKLMHTAGLLGEHVHHSSGYYGWGAEPVEEYNEKFEVVHPKVPTADWDRLRQNVMNHIGSLNWGYTSELGRVGVTYLNNFAKFVDNHTIDLCDGSGNVVNTVTARRVLLATGGRPTLLDIPGAKEFCITSDDLFALPTPPKKTLFIGASYVSLECAGFVNSLGFEGTTVMMRSIPLRGFDVDMAQRVVKSMEARGVTFVRDAQPHRIEKNEADGRLTVHYGTSDGNTFSEVFDTVCMAVGRRPETHKINLAAAGDVALDPKSGKIVVTKRDQTTVPNVYAIGDIIEGGLELTPVAIKAGKMLAARLYDGKKEVMNYKNIPTTVFTPLEYGCVGLSEEDAIAQYGDAAVEVYHTAFTPLEWNLPHFTVNECYMKLIVNTEDDERVLGFHILSPNAGEIVQGVAVAIAAKATKSSFDETIGIHPTIAEDMTLLKVTKRSGGDANKAGC